MLYAHRRITSKSIDAFSVIVLDVAGAAVNFHSLYERIVNGDNLSNDIAAVGVHAANFQPLITKTINLRSQIATHVIC